MKKEFLLSVVALFGFVAWGQDVPKVEVPVGFSMVNVHPNLAPITSFNVFGGGGQFDVNFGNYFGVKADFMGYTQGSGLKNQLRDKFDYTYSASGNVFTYMFGPQIKKHTGIVQPFGEVLVGAAHTNAYANIANAEGGSASGSGNNNGFALAAGGGIDFKINRYFSARPVEVDYLLTRFSANHVANYTANQNNFRYVGGVVFTFGGAPPIPPTASCSVSPSQIMAGDPVSASVVPQGINPKHTVTYSWTSSGGRISGTTETANIATAGLAPGSYTVSATATDEKEKKNNTASCSASFTVKQPLPPTASCVINPNSLKSGDMATLSVVAQSPQGSALTYAYAATAGRISGTGSSATLDTTGAAAGSPITATATVTDSQGLTGTCEAVVNVAPLPPPQVVQETTKVGECSFNNSNKPGRVDNECKATLDQVALLIQKEPNDTYVVVGYAEDEETEKMTQLAGQRAVNVKYYLTQGEGGQQIDPSLLQVKAGAEKTKAIRIYRVPNGAAFTEQTTTVDETQVQGQSRNASATRHHKKAAADGTAPATQQ
jgi:outer membrane protein OmpA-like peptidoglycan-associated protein